MLGLLVTLIYINISIRELPFGIIKASFGIYLGWICIATIANVTTLLVNAGWNGFNISQEVWTIIMILTGTVIIAITIYRLRNPFVGFSFPSIGQFFLSLLAGLVLFLALFVLYQALEKFEASRVIPAIGGILPLFTLGLVYFLSSGRETLTVQDFIAFALLVLGSF
jgi:magnesium-transporting ATPase (P-type)